MPLDYSTKTYGRKDEVNQLYKLFDTGRNISMHGPRRLGKTFVLDRIVDAAAGKGWTAVKVELAGCADSRSVFRELCSRIGKSRSGGARAISWMQQRLGQFLDPRTEIGGTWYQPFVTLDHEAYFERLIHAMHDDKHTRWVLLIDELPIFLKALHDKGSVGVIIARDFMNMVIKLQQQYTNVRWMITGSIGIEPLAQEGKYMGVLAKFSNFELTQLSVNQAKDFLKDLAKNGQILNRDEITESEADELISAVGWRAAYYIDALAQKLEGDPQHSEDGARKAIESAIDRLIDFKEMTTFGVWEEHIRKHYSLPDQKLAFSSLNKISQIPAGMDYIDIEAQIEARGENVENLRGILIRLTAEGFLTSDSWGNQSPKLGFANPLLRRWWLIAQPH